MEIKYTFHSECRAKKRKIKKVWIEEAIKFPDKVEKEFDKIYARKKLNGLTIEVVYVKEKYIKVLSVYWI